MADEVLILSGSGSDYTTTPPSTRWPVCRCGHVLWHEREQTAGACFACLKAAAVAVEIVEVHLTVEGR